MKNDSDDKILLVKKLENILTLVNDWLKYSDQKLAGLAVLNGGILWGYTRYLNSIDINIYATEILNFLVFLSLYLHFLYVFLECCLCQVNIQIEARK